MRIHVRYFAVFRERLGRDAEELELPEGADVDAAIELLAARHEAIAALRGRFRVALNQEMVAGDAGLADDDELALIPPVAGGADAPKRLARIIAEPPSLDRVVAAVSGPEMGGIATFTGVVRRTSGGREVERLEYESYPEMVDKVLEALCAEIESETAGCRVAIEHREGVLRVGDVAVVVAAAAPHRAEAFVACRAAIDRLKERAPIWKKEVGPGGAEWVGLGP